MNGVLGKEVGKAMWWGVRNTGIHQSRQNPSVRTVDGVWTLESGIPGVLCMSCVTKFSKCLCLLRYQEFSTTNNEPQGHEDKLSSCQECARLIRLLNKYWSSVVLLYEGRGRRHLVLGTWVPSEGTSCVSAPGPHVTFSVRPSLTIPMNISSPPHPAWSPAFSFLLDSSLLNVLYSVCSTLCFTCLFAILSFHVSSRRRGMIVLSTDMFLMLVTVGGTCSVFYL